MEEYKHPDISPTATATSARVGAAPATVTGMRLYLLRHASAQAGGDPVPDALRPLTAEGHREAAAVGAWLAGRATPPTHILCSSARRAVETMEGVAGALPARPSSRVSEALYLASASKLFELVRGLEQHAVSSLLLVAHNPGLADLAARLPDRGDPDAMRSVSRRFLPASLAEIELPGERWADLEPEGGTLVSLYIA